MIREIIKTEKKTEDKNNQKLIIIKHLGKSMKTKNESLKNK